MMEAAAERDRAERDALRAEVRARDRATALLAHELRGPMNVILGWARLLRDDANDPAQLAKALATIERQAQAQALIVNELLDASAHAVGPTRPRFEHVDVGALVRDVVESARPVTDAASVEVECFAPDGVEVVGDAARLQQVLSSLLCDVARVMPRGGHVVVRCARCYDRDRAVEVVISDGDRGLSEATLREALRRFSGADDGRSGTEPRLGLLLIERFVALHGGTLRVESDPDGRGARCRVCLPGG